MKPLRLLDLFSGAGGCSVGYSRAGFEVYGVDNRPMPRYPYPERFEQRDAIEALRTLIDGGTVCGLRLADVDAIHASPPCQAYSRAANNGSGRDAPRLIEEVRALIVESGVSAWAIENVEGAPLHFAATICGASFGLGASGYDLPRHRMFECSHLLIVPPCRHRRGKTIGVYGNGTNSWHREKMGRCLTEREKALAMGIDWMNRAELTQAIPPAYTEFVGRQLADHCRYKGTT